MIVDDYPPGVDPLSRQVERLRHRPEQRARAGVANEQRGQVAGVGGLKVRRGEPLERRAKAGVPQVGLERERLG